MTHLVLFLRHLPPGFDLVWFETGLESELRPPAAILTVSLSPRVWSAVSVLELPHLWPLIAQDSVRNRKKNPIGFLH